MVEKSDLLLQCLKRKISTLHSFDDFIFKGPFERIGLILMILLATLICRVPEGRLEGGPQNQLRLIRCRILKRRRL
jgi:hypothetical protein